jgi:hypothetical protein
MIIDNDAPQQSVVSATSDDIHFQKNQYEEAGEKFQH